MELELDRLAHHVETDKMDRISDCLCTLSDKGPNATEESKFPRLTELEGFALRGFGTFPTHLGACCIRPRDGKRFEETVFKFHTDEMDCRNPRLRQQS